MIFVWEFLHIISSAIGTILGLLIRGICKLVALFFEGLGLLINEIKEGKRADAERAARQAQASYEDPLAQWEKEAAPELAARKAAGQDVEDFRVGQSYFDGLPYPCLFDWEIDIVKEALEETDGCKKVVRMQVCLLNYIAYGHLNDPQIAPFNIKKGQYWLDALVEMAAKGSVPAKAVVARVCSYDGADALNTNAAQSMQESCREEVIALSRQGDKVALWSEAFFIERDADKRRELNEKAAAQGFSASYAELYHCEKDENKKRELAIKGAECDDGPEAYWFQDHIGTGYYYGDYGFPVDKEKALYWTEKAAANGNRSAQTMLEGWNK